LPEGLAASMVSSAANALGVSVIRRKAHGFAERHRQRTAFGIFQLRVDGFHRAEIRNDRTHCTQTIEQGRHQGSGGILPPTVPERLAIALNLSKGETQRGLKLPDTSIAPLWSPPVLP